MDAITRRATAEDVQAIEALVKAAYGKWVPLIGREPLPMTADYAARVGTHRFDLMHVGGELAALIETVAETDALLIENVAVDPRFQKRGFGRELVALAERLAREAGYTTVRLYTNAGFEENLRLYTSLGYATDREEFFNGGTLVHMRKPLG